MVTCLIPLSPSTPGSPTGCPASPPIKALALLPHDFFVLVRHRPEISSGGPTLPIAQLVSAGLHWGMISSGGLFGGADQTELENPRVSSVTLLFFLFLKTAKVVEQRIATQTRQSPDTLASSNAKETIRAKPIFAPSVLVGPSLLTTNNFRGLDNSAP